MSVVFCNGEMWWVLPWKDKRQVNVGKIKHGPGFVLVGNLAREGLGVVVDAVLDVVDLNRYVVNFVHLGFHRFAQSHIDFEFARF